MNVAFQMSDINDDNLKFAKQVGIDRIVSVKTWSVKTGSVWDRRIGGGPDTPATSKAANHNLTFGSSD